MLAAAGYANSFASELNHCTKKNRRQTMTELLKKAFEQASKLSESEQDSLARWLMNEIASERKWEKAFAESEDVLDTLADEALEEHKKGATKPLDT